MIRRQEDDTSIGSTSGLSRRSPQMKPLGNTFNKKRSMKVCAAMLIVRGQLPWVQSRTRKRTGSAVVLRTLFSGGAGPDNGSWTIRLQLLPRP